MATNYFTILFFNESSRHNYEIDFLIAKKNKVCPIEVKSSGYKTHKSLDEFSIKFSNRILQKISRIYKGFLKRQRHTLSACLYDFVFVRRILFKYDFNTHTYMED